MKTANLLRKADGRFVEANLFVAYRNGVELGNFSAPDYATAKQRAYLSYGRCEVLAVSGLRKGTDNVVESRTHGRAPYATPGFEARRAALIAAHKAGE
jgi:hypothetical protein